MCVCVFKVYLQRLYVGRRDSGTGHLFTNTRLAICPHRLEAIRLNRSRRKPCPSVSLKNVAISFLINHSDE